MIKNGSFRILTIFIQKQKYNTRIIQFIMYDERERNDPENKQN